MMTRRQAAFREDYRQRVSPWYSGWGHVALIYAIGGAAIWYFTRHIHGPSVAEWLIVPAAFLLSNGFEWWIHRYVMHRPVKGLMGIYKRHTLAHHQFFTDREPTLETSKDFRITFFPPYALVVFILMTAAGAAIVAEIWSANAAWLLLCATTGVYLNYEFFHWGCHVRDDRIIRHIPFMNTIRRHHIAHHNQAIMMGRNMNLTYPIADWLFGTSDLDRGLWGTIFNGYDTRFLKSNLPVARSGVDDPRAGRIAA